MNNVNVGIGHKKSANLSNKDSESNTSMAVGKTKHEWDSMNTRKEDKTISVSSVEGNLVEKGDNVRPCVESSSIKHGESWMVDSKHSGNK